MNLLPFASDSPNHRQSFRTAPELEVVALYGLTIEVHAKRLFRLDREGWELAIEQGLVPATPSGLLALRQCG